MAEEALPSSPQRGEAGDPGIGSRFDLTEQAERSRRAARASNAVFIFVWAGCGGIGAIAFGVLNIAGRISGGFSLGAGAILVGGVILLLGALVYSRLGGGAAVGLKVDASGLHIDRLRGAPLFLDWSDPRLKFELNVFARGAETVLPMSDARRASPYWLDVWRYPSRWVQFETTLPREAVDAIASEARRHPVVVSQMQACYYWEFSMKGSGSLAYNVEGRLQKSQALNGEVTKVRGTAWGDGPDE